MINLKIKLNSISDVQNFVTAVSRFNGDIDLKSDRYVVNAKSIMGIFSLDLMQPVDMTVYADSADELIKDIKDFIIE